MGTSSSITIAALQEYRKIHEKLVDRVTEVKLPTKYGEFKAYGFVNRLNGEHHVALVKGEIADGRKCALPSTFRVSHRRCIRLTSAATVVSSLRRP